MTQKQRTSEVTGREVCHQHRYHPAVQDKRTLSPFGRITPSAVKGPGTLLQPLQRRIAEEADPFGSQTRNLVTEMYAGTTAHQPLPRTSLRQLPLAEALHRMNEVRALARKSSLNGRPSATSVHPSFKNTHRSVSNSVSPSSAHNPPPGGGLKPMKRSRNGFGASGYGSIVGGDSAPCGRS
jgi:hypothetical protein